MLSLVIGHLISDAIATAGLLLLGITVPRINARHRDSEAEKKKNIKWVYLEEPVRVASTTRINSFLCLSVFLSVSKG